MSEQRTSQQLRELQALPLSEKILISQTRIIEWYVKNNGRVYVSFSGGKDSTVLLHLVRSIYPNVPAVFSNTGLEYPELQKFVRKFDNTMIVTPSMRFDQVVTKYGYPLISKEVAEAIYYARRITDENRQEKTPKHERQEFNKMGGCEREDSEFACLNPNARRKMLIGTLKKPTESDSDRSAFNKVKWLPVARDLPVKISHYCCYKMKKSPLQQYQHKVNRVPFIATLAEESRVRKQAWIKHGCNAFEGKKPSSQPLSFWTEQDILEYIVKYGLEIASVYGDIVVEGSDGNHYIANEITTPCGKLSCSKCQRTGCTFCGFGFHLEKGETRFQRLAKTHPRQYEYSIGGGQWVDNPDYDPVAPKFDGEWQNWNPKKIWIPSKEGLGMGKVFDMMNELYGKDFYRYE